MTHLRDASWCGRNAGQVKFAQVVVVFGHWPFAFEDLDGDGGLVVRRRRENLRFLRGNHSVAGGRKEIKDSVKGNVDDYMEIRGK